MLRARNRGFSLLELLATLGIVGVLATLALPAVQQTRAAAWRTQCTGHLHQIGVAFANYNATHGTLPPGYVSTFNAATLADEGPGWGWAALLLPYAESAALHDELNFSRHVEHRENATARVVPVASYLCPADRMPRSWMAAHRELLVGPGGRTSVVVQPIAAVAGANYVGVYGTGEPGPAGDGVLFRNSRVRYADIADGLSRTAFAGERGVALNSGQGWATWVGAPYGATLLANGGGDPDSPSGGWWVEAACGMVLGHSGEGRGAGDAAGDPNQFFSPHGRGAYFVFGDGHVAWAPNEMDYLTYRAMTTRAGGESFASDLQ